MGIENAKRSTETRREPSFSIADFRSLAASGAHHSGDLLDLVRLDDVADLDVLVPVEADAALEALLDLGDVVLEAAQRADLALVDDAVVAQQPQLRVRGIVPSVT